MVFGQDGDQKSQSTLLFTSKTNSIKSSNLRTVSIVFFRIDYVIGKRVEWLCRTETLSVKGPTGNVFLRMCDTEGLGV